MATEAPKDKTERVDVIRRLMLSNKWVTGQTARVLARKWGVSVSVVQDASAEASRQICMSVEDKVEMKAKIWGMLETAAYGAMSETSGFKRAKALEGIATLMLKITGIDRETRDDRENPKQASENLDRELDRLAKPGRSG